MDTLTGWALQMNVGTDHAYVTSSNGDIWKCWGRFSGGRQICVGTGSAREASCISEPDAQAGIIYGITGLCWQTANRILYPSGNTVSGAQGYTEVPFGRYGEVSIAGPIATLAAIWEWSQRRSRCSGPGGPGGPPAPPPEGPCPPDRPCPPTD